MTSANDNSSRPRQVRDGVLRRWPDVDISQIASDEALGRLADARNTASQSANRFMGFAALLVFLYFLRLQGIAGDLKFGDYSLADLPFGLFLLAVAALTISTVALVRAGDARSYDRYLRLGCEAKYDSGCELRYQAFPNAHAWGEPFSVMVSMPKVNLVTRILRALSLFLINMFLFVLIVLPALAAIDFLVGDRATLDHDFQFFRKTILIFLLAANICTLYLLFWARMTDRD